MRGLERTNAGLPRAGAAVAAIRDGLTAGYLEVKCLGCNVALDIVRGPKITPVHQLGRYLRCRECSAVRRYAFKRSQLIALRQPRSLRRALH